MRILFCVYAGPIIRLRFSEPSQVDRAFFCISVAGVRRTCVRLERALGCCHTCVKFLPVYGCIISNSCAETPLRHLCIFRVQHALGQCGLCSTDPPRIDSSARYGAEELHDQRGLLDLLVRTSQAPSRRLWHFLSWANGTGLGTPCLFPDMIRYRRILY